MRDIVGPHPRVALDWTPDWTRERTLDSGPWTITGSMAHGPFWHLLSALGGSLPWLEMWCGSNEMLHSKLSRKRGEVFWNKQHHPRRTRKIVLRLDWSRQMKVGLRNFTIYWLSNELFSFSSLQEYEIREWIFYWYESLFSLRIQLFLLAPRQ